MKKTILALLVITVVVTSCGRALSPADAASGKYKTCRAVK
jgi:hypothetical protein